MRAHFSYRSLRPRMGNELFRTGCGDAATRGFEAAGHSVSPDRRVHNYNDDNYNDRRKFKRSCFWEELRLLNFPTTACASEFELQFWLAEVGAFVWGPPKPKPQP